VLSYRLSGPAGRRHHSIESGRFNLVEERGFAIAAALILAQSHFLYLATGNQIRKADAAQKLMNLLAQITPQVMGQTGITAVTVAQTLAASRINRLINGIDHLRHLNTRHVAGKLITTTRPAHTADQIAAEQLGKQLLDL